MVKGSHSKCDRSANPRRVGSTPTFSVSSYGERLPERSASAGQLPVCAMLQGLAFFILWESESFLNRIREAGTVTADEKFMKEAKKQAMKAYALREVPIGCVIVYDGKIIARGYNRRNTDKNTVSHAEINAIRKASKKLGDWRLEGCTLYVTLEPCQMCAGAIIQARMDRVVIASMNPKAGCAGSVLNLLEMDGFNHKAEVTRGVLEEECSAMLTGFFRELREEKAKRKLEEKERKI